jgi:hypothetical protein
MLERVFIEFDRGDNNVELACWYSLYDQSLLGAPEWMITAFKNMGMHVVDGTPKPTWMLWNAVYETPATSVISSDGTQSNGAGPELITPYPNPFNASTVIGYAVTGNDDQVVRIDVYNIRGERVAQLCNARKPPGKYSTIFNADHLGSGLYIIKMQAGGIIKTTKAVLVR